MEFYLEGQCVVPVNHVLVSIAAVLHQPEIIPDFTGIDGPAHVTLVTDTHIVLFAVQFREALIPIEQTMVQVCCQTTETEFTIISTLLEQPFLEVALLLVHIRIIHY